MPTIGELYRSEKVTWRDRTLTIGRASFATEAAYRSHLEAEARAAINRHRPTMDATEYKAQLAAWQEACAAKIYEYGTDVWARSMASRENTVRWFWLVVTQDGPDGKQSPSVGLTLGDMERAWDEVGAAIAEAWARLREAEASADPTAAAKEAAAA